MARVRLGLLSPPTSSRPIPRDTVSTGRHIILDRHLPTFKGLVAASLSLSLLFAAVTTIHWPIVGDAALFHYIVFLLDHGKAPYREIVDINLPGTLALQWAAIHLLGPGALAWRIFDYLLLSVCLGSMIYLAWPVDWLAGLFAGTLFCLLHFRDGPTNTGQRDLMMTAMLLPACALLAHSWRAARRWPLLAAGVLLGMASLIKPAGLLFTLIACYLLCTPLPPRSRRQYRLILPLLIGFLFPVTLTAAYLLRKQALTAFLKIDFGLVPYHASLGRASLPALIVGVVPSVLLAVTVLAIPAFISVRLWKTWEGKLLLSGFATGAVSYVLQGKGFSYHRYPADAFLLLLIATLLIPQLQRSPSWLRIPALAGVLAGAIYLAPASARLAARYDWRNLQFTEALSHDLAALGGSSLDGEIQCLDMTAGCLNTLYHQHLLQSTGFLYDCYLFQSTQTPVSTAYRASFLQAMQARPPRVIVLTNETCFTNRRDFSFLANWPQFSLQLDRNYTLTHSVTPPDPVFWWRNPAIPYSYRIYVLTPRT